VVFLSYFILLLSAFASLVECEAKLVLLVLRQRYYLKEAQLFESVWSYFLIISIMLVTRSLLASTMSWFYA
jgi:hypothetical protein